MTSPRASLYSFQPSSTVPPQQSSTMAVPNQNAPHHPLSALVNNHSSERLVKREPGHGHGECDPLRYFDEPEAYLSHASASAPTSVSSQASTVVASTISITDSTTATSTTMDGQTGEMRLSYPKEEPMEIKLGSDHPHQRPQPQQYGHAPYALARHHPLDPVPMGSYSLSSH
ncbi:hypothetical protein BGW38_008694 [Lunasporangiospora selenospora]|uniref:Uncharacterized protein n=1 Tax=Lunasporangiospora selenospora TaxID=979761 RepID=A0A9P6FKX8_9FUNG|nr:hypothetical protein BGW38_008694 [Lunasporangiospora selenospora]